jgi:membrane protease YdiL (CAAX protease family)
MFFGFSVMMTKVTEYLQGGAQYTPFALVALSIQKSIAEEFLFRGYLFNYLRKYNFKPLFAILFQSLIFVALHTYRYTDNWILLSIIFLFGIIGGCLTWKSDNLIPASIMHIVVNLFTVAWRLS